MSTEILVIGHITIDANISFKKKTAFFDVIAGNAIGAAIGVRHWINKVSVLSRLGDDFPRKTMELLNENKINLINRQKYPHPTLKFWILDEGGLEPQSILFNESELIEMSPNVGDFDLSKREYSTIHIAPMPLPIQKGFVDHFRQKAEIISLDPHPISFIGDMEENKRTLFSILESIDVFMPSKYEVNDIFGDINLYEASRIFSDYGPKAIITKNGKKGVVVYDSSKDEVRNLPNYPSSVVETTGAGDSFCGGFISMYTITHDLILSAVAGLISASIIIEDVGVLHGLGKKMMAKDRYEKMLTEL